MIDLHAIKAIYPLVDLVMAHDKDPVCIGGRMFWRCPFHSEETPSFSIIPGSNRYFCFGCDATGDVIDYVMNLEGLDFIGAVAFLQAGRCSMSNLHGRPSPRRPNSTRRVSFARQIWRHARPAENTPVEDYLRSRGITLPVPLSLRHHSDLHHGPSQLRLNCMVAAVQGHDRQIIGLHRTYLRVDGRKADVSSPKMMLGRCHGGAVRLALAEDRLLVAEGIESALSAMQLMDIPAWAALSTSGLRALVLPQHIREIVIAADGDEAGQEAADAAAERWTLEGRRVRILLPPNGSDFNDLILGQVSHRKENAA